MLVRSVRLRVAFPTIDTASSATRGTRIVATTQPWDQIPALPVPLTPLIGREREVAAVRDAPAAETMSA